MRIDEVIRELARIREKFGNVTVSINTGNEDAEVKDILCDGEDVTLYDWK